MSFTMPQFEILEGDEVNPLAGILNKSATVSQNRTKAKYAPMTMQADAMSKMAYANLMAPQFLAKLMGNPDVVANMTEEQKQQALGRIFHSAQAKPPFHPFQQQCLDLSNHNQLIFDCYVDTEIIVRQYQSKTQ